MGEGLLQIHDMRRRMSFDKRKQGTLERGNEFFKAVVIPTKVDSGVEWAVSPMPKIFARVKTSSTSREDLLRQGNDNSSGRANFSNLSHQVVPVISERVHVLFG
eukprot:TRINITY_DN3803_c0_g1_i2.p4 TRINITY_DN3803_c0_g1~~TRINITY_DN3803_c0_g1_i2.p4  ORF type:complete len:104 (-),score=7.52 TRINITY_DN3803_c0_g1_i2:423-734(-)